MENEVVFLRQESQTPTDGRLFTPEMKAELRTTQKQMLDRLVMLFAPTVMAWYYYGSRALWLVCIAVLTAVVCEGLGMKILGRHPTLRDLSAVVTGVTVALCLPASSPAWLIVLAVSFAILAAKLPFGTARSLLFSPAAAGLAFVTVCLPQYVFAYPALPASGESVPVFGSSAFTEGVSLTQMLQNRASVGGELANYLDILLGAHAGAMGTGCMVALFGALLFLLLRRPKQFTAAIGFLAAAAIFALLFPRTTAGRGQSVAMELCGGMLVFGALFLLSEEPFLPKTFYGRLVYGVCGGVFCMLFRRFGAFEEGVMFAVLLTQALSGVFNRLPDAGLARRLQAHRRRKDRSRTETALPEEGGAADA